MALFFNILLRFLKQAVLHRQTPHTFSLVDCVFVSQVSSALITRPVLRRPFRPWTVFRSAWRGSKFSWSGRRTPTARIDPHPTAAMIITGQREFLHRLPSVTHWSRAPFRLQFCISALTYEVLRKPSGRIPVKWLSVRSRQASELTVF